MSAAWKPTLYMRLSAQSVPEIQIPMFGVIAPEVNAEECEHPGYGIQTRFDGSQDEVCTKCGKVR